jgi:hypothetical protein
MTATAKNRMMIYGPNADGTYIVHVKTPLGDKLCQFFIAVSH